MRIYTSLSNISHIIPCYSDFCKLIAVTHSENVSGSVVLIAAGRDTTEKTGIFDGQAGSAVVVIPRSSKGRSLFCKAA